MWQRVDGGASCGVVVGRGTNAVATKGLVVPGPMAKADSGPGGG